MDLHKQRDRTAVPAPLPCPHPRPAPEPLRPDPLAGSAYQAIRRLGGGATAEVYEAVHTELDRLVVVKLLRAELVGDATALERMRFEARALARLSHPNLTAVTDFGQTLEGRPFFVMERHEGRPLLRELRHRGYFVVPEAAALMHGILAGLTAAHALGVIHRDLKLENVFLCEDERGARTAKILDFGIAKLLPDADPARAPAPRALPTEEGVTVGTPRFLSPEQVRCLAVDRRTDVYGAAMVFYELIAGRDPFHDVRDYVGLLQAHASQAPPPPSALAPQPIPPAVDDVVLRALSKRPEDRYATAAAFSEAISLALGAGTMGAAMPTPDNATFKPGEVFRGQHRILDFLGEGLHGEVYRVEHVHTGDLFALKVLRLVHTRDVSQVQRALRTAKASFKIQHENAVLVHDIGCEDDGKVWLLMELLDGVSLGASLARTAGKVSLPFAFHVVVSVGWAVDAAHELQVIHRDLKPDNLWVTDRGVVKVLDWSIAKVIPDGVKTTQRSTGLGTAPYTDPAILRGGKADARADVYALGMILYEMLAGRHAFWDVFRNTAEMVRRQLFVEPEPLSAAAGLPPYVDDFMRRAISKDPDARFLSMAEMVKAAVVLRDRLLADAARGILDIVPVPGEGPICEDPRGERAYAPLARLPEPAEPPPVPSQRVVVPDAAAGTTEPPAAPEPGRGPKGTQKLVVTGPKGTLPLGGTLPLASGPIASPAARETAPAVERSPSPFAATTRASRSRGPARLAALLVSFTVAAGLGTLAWLRLRAPAPGKPSAAASASAPARPVGPAAEPATAEPATAEPATAEPATAEPATAEPAASAARESVAAPVPSTAPAGSTHPPRAIRPRPLPPAVPPAPPPSLRLRRHRNPTGSGRGPRRPRPPSTSTARSTSRTDAVRSPHHADQAAQRPADRGPRSSVRSRSTAASRRPT